MTAQPHDFVPGGTPDPAKSLRAIRAALVVRQDREAFDAGLKAVLDEVRVNLDLGVLNDFVHRWWISACDSARDPEGRRHMHARAEQVLAGEPSPRTRPWREILAEREGSRQMYRLSLDPIAEDQINVRAVHLAGDGTWERGAVQPAKPRGNMLTHAFGELGLATYLVLGRTA